MPIHASTTPPPSAPPCILVVDDEPGVNAMFCRAFRQMGYEVVSAADGLEALAWLRRQPIAVIVSDIVMPNLNGIELCRWVRADPAWAHIPLIMLSGKDPRLFPPNLATQVLQKPVTLDALELIIRDLLSESV
jgi:CheY-like chemotaxis protein